MRDTGLPVYPGAKLKPNSNDGDHKSANVNLSAFGFGLKVVATEYESDDAPGKIIAYYQDQLKNTAAWCNATANASNSTTTSLDWRKEGLCGCWKPEVRKRR